MKKSLTKKKKATKSKDTKNYEAIDRLLYKLETEIEKGSSSESKTPWL